MWLTLPVATGVTRTGLHRSRLWPTRTVGLVGHHGENAVWPTVLLVVWGCPAGLPFSQPGINSRSLAGGDAELAVALLSARMDWDRNALERVFLLDPLPHALDLDELGVVRPEQLAHFVDEVV